MRKRKHFMIFYQDIALLHSVANKQTLFFAEMMARMDGDNIVQMTPYIRELIVDNIGSKTNNKLALARQYIKTLSDAGLIIDIGKGAYMVAPKIAGFSCNDQFIKSKQAKFLKITYLKDKRSMSMGFEDDDYYAED